MSDTKPYQAAAERLMPLLYERLKILSVKSLELHDQCVELIRAAIAAEVDAERKRIQVDLDELGRVWGGGTPGHLHYCSASERVRSRIGAPSALEAMAARLATAETDLNGLVSHYKAVCDKRDAIGIERDQWADAIRTVAPGYIASPEVARRAIQECKDGWDAARAERDRAIAERDEAQHYLLAEEERRKLTGDALAAEAELSQLRAQVAAGVADHMADLEKP